MIDTHSHINSEVIQKIDEEIIKIQNSKYVDKVVNIGTNIKTCQEALLISEKYDKFFTAIGIHPLEDGNVDDLYSLYKSVNSDKIVAIGETGLDTARDLKPQIEKFIQQIELANTLKLPLIIHSNNTNELALENVKKYIPQYGFVFHCFQPNLEIAKEIVKMDGFLSFGTPITRKTAKKSLEVIQNVPIDNILIELDYPYMSKEPTVDGVNVFKRVKELTHLSKDELEEKLDENAKRLYMKLK